MHHGGAEVSRCSALRRSESGLQPHSDRTGRSKSMDHFGPGTTSSRSAHPRPRRPFPLAALRPPRRHPTFPRSIGTRRRVIWKVDVVVGDNHLDLVLRPLNRVFLLSQRYESDSKPSVCFGRLTFESAERSTNRSTPRSPT